MDIRPDPDDRPPDSFATVPGATERLEAEPARHDAQDLFRAAFHHAPIGMALTGLDGYWLKVNPAVSTITGYSEADLLQRGFQGITHPDDVPRDRAALELMRDGRRDAYQAEKRYLTRSGAHIWVLLSVALVRGPSDEPLHMVAQIVDITRRKRLEHRLRRAEAAARAGRDHATAILSGMSDGYALTVEGEIKAVNDALCKLTGFSAAQLIGARLPYPFWPPEHLGAIDAACHEVRGRTGDCHALTLMRADGERFEAEVTSRPAREENGRPLGFVNTFRDVSVQKRHERELERLARTDSLTLLANRHVLQEALEREAARRGGDGRLLALVLLDLDHFKQINDGFGHPAGDAVLVEVARRLERTVRAGEVLARVGGEEFAWLLPASGAAEAVAAADRARRLIASSPFAGTGRLTMSAGVAVVSTPSDGDALYRMADRALYEAKQRGRDRTCCLDGAAPAVAGAGPVTALPAALARGAERLDALA